MPVQLEAIAFNHDPLSATRDALNIRRNRSEAIAVPEWRRGLTFLADASPAAYAIAPTLGRTLTIGVEIAHLPPSGRTHVEIRALDERQRRGNGRNVLGTVRRQRTQLPPLGQSRTQMFELGNVQLSAGVGSSVTVWRWQFRFGAADPWTDLAVTSHRIYVVLDTPTDPWQQLPPPGLESQLPWTEVLHHACDWAATARNARAAAAAVTRRIYEIGLEYNCVQFGQTQYAWPNFNCTAFLNLLVGGPGIGGRVNCTDCATIVSTFANAVGCNLSQARMGMVGPFQLNPILAIGSLEWQTACQLGVFSYHEVAWTGACTENDDIFDACLQVDGDADPTRAPHVPLLPEGLRFGAAGDGTYRDRLAAPAGRAACVAQPISAHRKVVI